MDTPATDTPIDLSPAKVRERLWPALIIAPLLAWSADYLFWRHDIGLQLGLYFSLLALAVVGLHSAPGQRWRSGIAAGLILGAAVATALETSFTNTMVLIGLLAVALGESFYRNVAGTAWTRWSQALKSWLCALGRWPWLFQRLAASALVSAGLSREAGDVCARSIRAVAPAACLGVVFLVVFEAGNAVVREFSNRLSADFFNWIADFDFSIDHLAFWFAAGTLALALVQPREPAAVSATGPRRWERIERQDRTVAIWQSRFVLLLLNAMFFAVNTIDVAYLWQHTQLPQGVTFSDFVHSGVYSLTFATLLSAVVMAVMFQQSVEITRSRGLKALALVWIGQNLMLIAGVFLRLKLYVDAYQLSELRIYVGCFLLLVATGFGLLAWHVAYDGSLRTLIFRNTVAVFVLFYVLQFLDVAGFVARSNVTQWRKDSSLHLDCQYLDSLGPGGWMALCSVAPIDNPLTPEVLSARQHVWQRNSAEIVRRSASDWRSFQFRRHAADRLLEKTATTIAPGPIEPTDTSR